VDSRANAIDSPRRVGVRSRVARVRRRVASARRFGAVASENVALAFENGFRYRGGRSDVTEAVGRTDGRERASSRARTRVVARAGAARASGRSGNEVLGDGAAHAAAADALDG
jgi:hypothetical protein